MKKHVAEKTLVTAPAMMYNLLLLLAAALAKSSEDA